YCDAVGLEAQTRTEIPDVHEVVLAAANGGGRLQLAERYQNGSNIDHGFALWKIYMNVDDCREIFDRCVAAGATAQMEPARLDRWPVTVAMVEDLDGYLVELVQVHHGTAASA
ncbi:MAG: VOC family protein, partial [Mycobacterium sp.]